MNKHQGQLLVVDDNELNRDMLSRRLTRKGYQVDTAEDGYQALDLISQRSYELILLDIMMPGLSGIEVLQQLRQSYDLMALPIIMATAKTDSNTIVQSLKSGANDYVTKPLQFSEVLARVETQLSISRQARQRTSGSFHKLEDGDTEVPAAKASTIYCPNCLHAHLHDQPRCMYCDHLRPAEGWPDTTTSPYVHLGQIIGQRYHLEQFLDRGTTGEVYSARDLDIKRQYAAKIIKLSNTNAGITQDEVRQRTRLEVEAMVSLQNPHVVKIHEVAQIDDDTFALIMDFVKGLSLGAILERLGSLQPALALDITKQVAQGLYEAHQQGMIHCDIKPANVMLEKLPAGGYFVQILDFGIVQILNSPIKSQGFYGTPLYSSPERIREQEDIDHRADIYSLGAMLYHMLSGSPPYVADNVIKVFTYHLNGPIPKVSNITNANTQTQINALIAKMMAKSPNKRLPDLLHVIQAIDAITL